MAVYPNKIHITSFILNKPYPQKSIKVPIATCNDRMRSRTASRQPYLPSPFHAHPHLFAHLAAILLQVDAL